MKYFYWLFLLGMLAPFGVLAQVDAGPNVNVCSGERPFQLTGATPAGGIYTGTGVTPRGVFTPSHAQVGQPPIKIYYRTGDGLDSLQITIQQGPVIEAGKDTNLCSGQTGVRIIGTAGTPGTILWTPSQGLSSTTVDQPDVNVSLPNASGAGFITYVMRVSAGGCNSYDSVRVGVYPFTNLVPRPFDSINICVSTAPFELFSSTPNGYWFGRRGLGITLPNIYQHAASSPYPIDTIYYRLPCSPTSDNPPFKIIRTFTPDLDITPGQTICANNPPIQLIGNPGGGTWGGQAVRPDGLFVPSPALAPPGSSAVVTLGYTRTFNNPIQPNVPPTCQYTRTANWTILGVTPVEAGGSPEDTLCSNDDPYELTGAQPAGGTWTPTRNQTGGVVRPDSLGRGINLYTYTYIDPNGCRNSDTRQVFINLAPSVYAGADTTYCANGLPFQLRRGARPAGGTWSGTPTPDGNGRLSPDSTFVGVRQFKYTVFNNVTGCKAADSVQITFLDFPKNLDAGPDTAVCSNSPAFNLTRGYPAGGRWTGNSVNSLGRFVPSDLFTGRQRLRYRVTTPQGCFAQDSLFVFVQPRPRAYAGPDFTTCAQKVFKVGEDSLPNTRLTTFTYMWSSPDGVQGFSDTTKADPFVFFENNDIRPIGRTYYLSVKQEEIGKPACTSFDTLKVRVVPKPRARTLSPQNFRGCEGDTILLRADVLRPGYNYQWFTPRSVLNPRPAPGNTSWKAIATGTYYVRVVDTIRVRDGVCADTSNGDSVFIKKRNIPIVRGFANFCGGRKDTLYVSPASDTLNYQWLKENRAIIGATDTVFNAGADGNYRVVITDASNDQTCIDTSTVVRVDSIPRPYNNIVRGGSDTAFTACRANVPLFFAAPTDSAFRQPFFYRWQWRDSTLPNISRFLRVDSIGRYISTVYNRCGTVSDTFTLNAIFPTPNEYTVLRSGQKDTTVCQNIPFSIYGRRIDYVYRWNFLGYDSSGTSITVDTRDTTEVPFRINLRVINQLGCEYFDTVRVSIKPCIPQLYIPTAFSPQGDDVNDFWTMAFYNVTDARAWVYNRWGQQVYYAPDRKTLETFPWDGDYKDSPAPSGAYQYIVEFFGPSPDGQTILTYRKTGALTVIR